MFQPEELRRNPVKVFEIRMRLHDNLTPVGSASLAGVTLFMRPPLLGLFTPQRQHRIDFRRSECRNVAGEKNNGRKDGSGCQKERRIIGPNLKQNPAH